MIIGRLVGFILLSSDELEDGPIILSVYIPFVYDLQVSARFHSLAVSVSLVALSRSYTVR